MNGKKNTWYMPLIMQILHSYTKRVSFLNVKKTMRPTRLHTMQTDIAVAGCLEQDGHLNTLRPVCMPLRKGALRGLPKRGSKHEFPILMCNGIFVNQKDLQF